MRELDRIETKKEISEAPSLSAAELIVIRGVVRRMRNGVKKEQRMLLALQLKNRVPAAFVARQIEVMGG
jgi:hypothetical protein